jgi:hypothetical protein
VEVLVKLAGGRVLTARYPLDTPPGRSLTIETGERPQEVILDPNTILLFEGEMHEKP